VGSQSFGNDIARSRPKNWIIRVKGHNLGYNELMFLMLLVQSTSVKLLHYLK